MAWYDTLLLKSPNPRLRCRAVENLAGSSHPSDTDRIFASLHDENPQVRCAALRAVAKAKPREARAPLIKALKDLSFQVREAAARALGGLGDMRSAGPLTTCLRDPDAAVRIAAASGLRALGWRPSTREEVALFEIALGNTPATVSAETASIAAPSAGGIEETSFYRRMAAEDLRQRSDPARARSLLNDLQNGDLLTRVSAVHDLGKVNEPHITEVLLKLFRHRDTEIRLAAAQAVAAREDAPPGHFLGLLQDTSFEVRLAAVKFLGRIRHKQIAELLFPLLADPHLEVRQATATALGLIGNPCAIEALVVSLADEDEQMRLMAERALEQIDRNWMHSEGAQNARGRLEALLNVRPPSDGWVVELALGRLPPPEAAATDAP
jgi:HEAT repeat protein